MSKKNTTTTYTSSMQETVIKTARLEVMIAEIKDQLTHGLQKLEDNFAGLEKKLDLFEEKIESRYVTKEEHQLVRNIVFGMVGMILVAFMGFLLSMAFKG